MVPSFSPMEERRAPKNPDAPALWKQLQGDRERERIEGGLFICHLQVGRHIGGMERAGLDMATLGFAELFNADVTLKLKLRRDPTIVLWAPWKHNESFVSIPAVTLARGDSIDLSLIDTHVFSADRPLGHAAVRWDGHSPLVLTTDKWTASCALTDADEARFTARPWIDSVDRQLDKIAAAKVDRAQPHLGRPARELEQLKAHLRDETLEGNFRYAAGFLGWAHPEIQSRLARLRDGEAAFDQAAARAVEEIRSEVAAGPIDLHGMTLRLSASPRALNFRVESVQPIGCFALLRALGTLALVDDLGRFSKIEATLRDVAGRRCGPDSHDATLGPPLRGAVRTPARLRLVRLADGEFARID